MCGILLAISCLSWTKEDSDEENLEFGEYGPCAVTMRPEGPCRLEQEKSTCPYLFSVPPLTFHLPKQLRELENIVQEVQKLKDSVDELRVMCTDCTVRQTDVACAGQTEREHENLIVGMGGYEDERKRLKEEQSGDGSNDFHNSSQNNQHKAEHIARGDDVLKNNIFEEKEKDNWESERASDGVVIKDERKVQPVLKKEGETEGGKAKGKEKSKPAAAPTVSETDRIMDVVIKKMAEKQSKGVDMDRRKGKNGKGHSTGDRGSRAETERERKIIKDKIEDGGHPVWRDVTQGAEKRTKTAEEWGREGIKMSKNPDKHTNREREGLRQERKKEMEKGAKTAERNNKKPKQSESIRGMEKTIKEGVKEDVRQTEKEIKTGRGQMVQSVQRDSDGELALGKVTERTDFASVVPTAYAVTSSPSRSPKDLVKAVSFASSPPLPGSHLNSGISQELTTSAEEERIERTGLKTAVISERPGAEENFMTASSPITTPATTDTLNSVSNSGQIPSTLVRSVSTTSTNTERRHQLQATSTVSPASFRTSIRWDSPQSGLTDHNSTNKDSNLMPITNPGDSLSTYDGSVLSDPPALEPEGMPNLTKNTYQPGETSLYLPDQRPNEKVSSQQPATNQTKEPSETKPGNNTMNPKSQGTEYITDPNLVGDNELSREKSLKYLTSTQRPLPPQTPPIIDVRDTGEARLTEKDPQPEDMNMSEGAQEPPETLNGEGEPESGENQKNPIHFTTSNEPNNFQKDTKGLFKTPAVEATTETYESFGTEFTPDRGPTRLHRHPVKSGFDIPEETQRTLTSPDHPRLSTDQHGLKPEQNQMDQELRSTPQPEQNSVPTTSSVPHRIIQAGVDKTFGPSTTQGPLTQPVAKSGLETTTHSSLPRIATTSSGYLQKVHTDSPPTSGPVKLITDITHSAGGAKFSAREIISLEPNSFGSGPFPQHRTLSGGVTIIPNSRVPSDPWPQTETQTPSIQMTTDPNRITFRTLPSDTPVKVLGPTEPNQVSSGDASQQVNLAHKSEESPDVDNEKFIPPSSPRAPMSSTLSPHLSSTKPAVSGPEIIGPEVSTDSTRELRVKINQVAAFFNNSVRSNGRHPDPDRHPKVALGGKEEGLPSTAQGKGSFILDSTKGCHQTPC